MKNLLLSLSGGLLIFGIQDGISQTIVSTSPENKNVVLEEFTAIYCEYCPDGHKLAQELKDANPGSVVLVNIHTGDSADPNLGDPDFRTSWGSAMKLQSGVCEYPAGDVNRHYFPALNQISIDQNGDTTCIANTAMSKTNWEVAIDEEIVIGSPVNVAATATWNVDALANEIIIYVEVYYTANSNTTTNNLIVAILENNVPGPQTGGLTHNPNNFDNEGNYLHQHMLRDFVTGQWGVGVSTTTSGSFYSDTLIYAIPADYNGIAPDLTELEVAVYIAEEQQEILTGVVIPLTIINTTVNNSSLVSVGDLGAYCGYSATPQITIRNMGINPLTSLDISYNINGGHTGNYQWTGSLAFYEEEIIPLPDIAFAPAGTNAVNVSTSNPNGYVDDDPLDDSKFSTFTDVPEATSTTIDFELLTDNNGDETSWEVRDDLGTVVYSVLSNTYANNTTYNETWNIPDNGCYTFTIHDSNDDGFEPGFGYYRLTSNSVIIINGASFGSIEEKSFAETAGTVSLLVGTTYSTGSTSNTNCDGTATVVPSGGTGPYTFLWDDSNSQTTMTATSLCAGIYYPTIYDNDNKAIVESVTVADLSIPLTVMNSLQLADLDIFPIPFEEYTIVAFSLIKTQNIAISVLNLMGEEVVKVGGKVYESGNYQEQIDASGLPTGIYFIDVKVDGVSNVIKVIHAK